MNIWSHAVLIDAVIGLAFFYWNMQDLHWKKQMSLNSHFFWQEFQI